MKNYIVIGVVAFVTILSYLAGYDKAEDEYKLKLSEQDRLHQQAIIDAQEEEKEKYELQTKALVARFNADAEHNAQRMRQLEQKLRANRNVETVSSERDRCFELAVRGEGLLKRADAIIDALKR